MNGLIVKVLKCGDQITVKSEKSESGLMNKRTLLLQELGGKYENQFVATALGNLAGCQFYENDVVVATLKFTVHEYGDQLYQDVLVTDIVPLRK